MKKNDSKKFNWRIILKVLLLLLWAFASTVASQFIIGIIMSLILGAAALEQPIPLAIYYLLADTLAVCLVVFVPPRLAVEWKIGKKNKTAKSGKKEFSLPSRTELGLKGLPTWTDIGLAPVGFILSLLLASVAVAIFSQFSWFNAEEAQEVGFSLYMGGLDRVFSFFALAIVAPVAEEVIFRGWLYGKMRQTFNNLPEWGNVVLSTLLVSALFGLMHFQWNVGVNVFCLSVVLCGLREITGTIYAGVLTHMLRNGVAFYYLYVIGAS